MSFIKLTDRQEKIIDIVKEGQPITGEDIAGKLDLTRATLRPDLSILTMIGVLEARPKVGYFYSGKQMEDDFSEKIKELKISEIKSVPVVVSEETTVYDAIVNMFLENVGSIYVVSEGGILVGVVSRKDFLKNTIGGLDINKIPVGMIMTRMPNIVTVFPEENLLDAAVKIIDHEIDSVPVVEEVQQEEIKQYRVIGKISKTTIARAFVELFKNI
ncbi:transcriptional repressor CcpN [Andreesenia angusta]|uniref:Transcriptional repressor CcpN n=1 Tax=Andreesenia angusta TaxID=39480 RepID=A0A1S1V838_9FIRM|nr:helix-turn-helix transcriptional regulator [Andreesenia angusta]OHW62570.1 transcriptional repressor CcpN [Andreesenia angusta]